MFTFLSSTNSPGISLKNFGEGKIFGKFTTGIAEIILLLLKVVSAVIKFTEASEIGFKI